MALSLSQAQALLADVRSKAADLDLALATYVAAVKPEGFISGPLDATVTLCDGGGRLRVALQEIDTVFRIAEQTAPDNLE